MEDNIEIAACQPKIKKYDDKNSFEYAGASGGFLDKYGYPFCRGRVFETLEEDKGQYDDASEVFWASGACLFLRAEAFYEVGGFDWDFFAHMETPLDPKAQKAVEKEVKNDVKRDWFLANLDPDKVVEELSDEEWLEGFNPNKAVEEYHDEIGKGKKKGKKKKGRESRTRRRRQRRRPMRPSTVGGISARRQWRVENAGEPRKRGSPSDTVLLVLCTSAGTRQKLTTAT